MKDELRDTTLQVYSLDWDAVPTCPKCGHPAQLERMKGPQQILVCASKLCGYRFIGEFDDSLDFPLSLRG